MYITKHGTDPGPFFFSEPGILLMKATFVASVREGLHAVWVDECLYAGHSVPIGATTTAVEVGMEDSLTQKLSTWSSPAFLYKLHQHNLWQQHVSCSEEAGHSQDCSRESCTLFTIEVS